MPGPLTPQEKEALRRLREGHPTPVAEPPVSDGTPVSSNLTTQEQESLRRLRGQRQPATALETPVATEPAPAALTESKQTAPGDLRLSPEDQGFSPFMRGVQDTGEPIAPPEGFPSEGARAFGRGVRTGATTALETQGAIAELGTRASELTGSTNPIANIVLASGGEVNALPDLRAFEGTPTDLTTPLETIRQLDELQRQRPFLQQLTAGAIFDPLNAVPGLGFVDDPLKGLSKTRFAFPESRLLSEAPAASGTARALRGEASQLTDQEATALSQLREVAPEATRSPVEAAPGPGILTEPEQAAVERLRREDEIIKQLPGMSPEWLRSDDGRRWQALRELRFKTPTERNEFNRLQEQGLESIMSSEERQAFRAENAADLAEERRIEALDALDEEDQQAISGESIRPTAPEQAIPESRPASSIEQQSSLEQARQRLDEAKAELERLRATRNPAPKFGTPERADFDAERRRLASEGRPIKPKRQLLAEAREQLNQARADLARAEAEQAAITEQEPAASIWSIFGPSQIAEAASKKVPVQDLTPPPEGIRQAQELAAERIRQSEPGMLTKITDAIPGPRQVGRFVAPARDLPRYQHQAWVTRSTAKASYASNIAGERYHGLNAIEEAFGKAFRHGEKADLEYIGPAERAGSELIGTAVDVLPNPDYYVLNDAQKQAIAEFAQYQDFSLNHAIRDYGAQIGRFEVKPGGAFVPNVDISRQALDILGDEAIASRTGRAKTRVFQDAISRQMEDSSFVPLRDLDRLSLGADEAKANLVARESFKKTLGGKTLLEVMEETHPGLRKAKLAMAYKLQKLNWQLRTLERQSTATSTAIKRASTQLTQTQIRAEPILNRIDELGPEYGPELSYLSGQARELLLRQAALEKQGVKFIVRGAGQDIKKSRILTEINELAPQLETLRKRYVAANLRGYELVREGGVYRYFPHDEATKLRQLLEVSNSKFLDFIYGIRNVAFNLDLSPVTGVHLPMGFLADPMGTARQVGRGLRDIRQGRTLAESIGPGSIERRMAEDPVSWTDFFSATGRVPNVVPEEFAGGVINRIPWFGNRWGRINDTMWNLVTLRSKAMFDDIVKGLEKQGVAHNEAIVAASDTVHRAIPLVDPAILGQSQARAKLLNSVSISSSFVLKPVEMTTEFATALVKAGLRQPLTHKQRLALKVGLSFIATVETISATTAMLDAKAHGQDVEKAAVKALTNPGIYLLDGRVIPLGGAYRSLMNAVKPRWINKEMDYMVPFVNAPVWLAGKLTPALRRQFDLIRNKDARGRSIMTENFPVNVLQIAEYELEGVLPLSAGSAMEAYRHGESAGKIAEEAASQLMGSSIYDRPGPWSKRSEWRDDLRQYWAIPSSKAERVQGDTPGTRLQFRKNNPRIDAELFILGEVSSLQTHAAMVNAYWIIQEENFNLLDIKGIEKRKQEVAALGGINDAPNNVDRLIAYLERDLK